MQVSALKAQGLQPLGFLLFLSYDGFKLVGWLAALWGRSFCILIGHQSYLRVHLVATVFFGIQFPLS